MGKRGRPIGYRESAETRAKKSRVMTGRSHTEETKSKIREALRRHHNSLSEREVDLMEEIYNSKKTTVVRIAEMFHCSRQQVFNLMKERKKRNEEVLPKE